MHVRSVFGSANTADGNLVKPSAAVVLMLHNARLEQDGAYEQCLSLY